MKKAFISFSLILFSTAFLFSQGDIQLKASSIGASIIENNDYKLVFTNDISQIPIIEIKTKDGFYSRIDLKGYTPNTDYGKPELPNLNRIIEIPYGAKINVKLVSYNEQVVSLEELGFQYPLIPCQPSIFKNLDPSQIIFQKDESVYSGVQSYAPELVTVTPLSIMRGVQLARLSINPFSYDVQSNTLTVKNDIVVEITFSDADIQVYNDTKSKFYSPAFRNLYATIWNYKEPSTKDALSQYPIKYVIVSSPLFEDALQPFIEWKNKKGFQVIEAYTDDPSVGTTFTSIHNYLSGLYNAATPENPAPTYVLLVGDLAQIPSTNTGQHYSDMYTVEFDGSNDYVPDMYIGRFSATNLTQLAPQIEKTLMFEEYTFPDPSFLDEVVLVAGADQTYGPTHANGQINYANQYYFNEAHGMDPYVYLYPASANSEAPILANLSGGVGFVNYTAHCGSDGWGDPSFTTSNIPSLQNDNEYFFSIGNCCLSNKFDEPECFGEALLRAQHKGAVVHLGGSNNTLWNEDFYWSVGVAATINANPTYAGTTQAAYDHMFHENGEVPYVDAAKINYIGNMSVMESSSAEDEYYW